MVHPPIQVRRRVKPASRPTPKPSSNRLQAILTLIQKYPLWVWAVATLMSLSLAHTTLDILLSPGKIEPETPAPLVETPTQSPLTNHPTVARLALGAISLTTFYLVWRTLQNPEAHKRAAQKRRQRRAPHFSTAPLPPFKVPKRELDIPASESLPSIPVAPVSPPPPSPKPLTFEVTRTPQPSSAAQLDIPNFPRLAPPTPILFSPGVTRKTKSQPNPPQPIKKSS